MKKAALYDPYLDTMGGGERHILSILQVLDQEGYEIAIFWDTDLREEIITKLQIKFQHLRFEKNIFRHENQFTRLNSLKEFDHLFYVTDGSYFFSTAKQTHIFCMVPQKSLYNMSPLNKLKTQGAHFIVNSEFTKKWLQKWGVHADVIYPYIDDAFFQVENNKKHIILTVGRFFKELHSKRQDIAIKFFLELQQRDEKYKQCELHLAGSVLPDDMEYLEELKHLSSGNQSIVFHENVSFQELLSLYSQAEYYWHFAGYEVDENTHPEKTEHLGITPLEAMSSGCLTYAYRAGGPKEVINDGITGFLFTSSEELFKKMNVSEEQKKQMQKAARDSVSSHFSYNVFRERVSKIIV